MNPAQEQIAPDRSADSDGINSMMLVETSIFAADQGIDEIIGDFIKGDDLSIFSACKTVNDSRAIVDERALGHCSYFGKIKRQCPQIIKPTDHSPEQKERYS